MFNGQLNKGHPIYTLILEVDNRAKAQFENYFDYLIKNQELAVMDRLRRITTDV